MKRKTLSIIDSIAPVFPAAPATTKHSTSYPGSIYFSAVEHMVAKMYATPAIIYKCERVRVTTLQANSSEKLKLCTYSEY